MAVKLQLLAQGDVHNSSLAIRGRSNRPFKLGAFNISTCHDWFTVCGITDGTARQYTTEINRFRRIAPLIGLSRDTPPDTRDAAIRYLIYLMNDLNMKPPQTHIVSAAMLKWSSILRSQSTHPNEMTTAIWGELKTVYKLFFILDGRATIPDEPALIYAGWISAVYSCSAVSVHWRALIVFFFLALRILGQQHFRGNLVSTVDSDEVEDVTTTTAQRIHFWADLKYQFVAAGIPQELITPLTSHSFRRGFAASALAITMPQRIISAI
ncbi:hypothetical protein SARC_11014 [Sphaeroforma arctica JP610]|uniref:Uncharacterized protein n=1 Tax=Sphaeroforma arctica JP610 TaxID=667725 RepID=A0A0L0FI81_9EUKA|nr:hypothetical protein SARC_11014 [Sphaeroforma arctica JP610]KNC76489.1 hypothetical protein SARC_11014 [Sphaeroforma arctica JP610]|eukprot:XP_014150391.1 hypothetical protein SARC_11014 [Sphaeroforma arctica JP610]